MKLANPFLTAGYDGPEYFCDRKRESETLIGNLDNDRNTTLISPRRYGKTVRQVLHLMSKRRGVKTVYVDLYPTRCLSDFANVLATAVAESVASPAEKAIKAVSAFARGFRPTMTIDEFSGRPKFSFDINARNAQSSLESILEYLQSRKARTIVAIDECRISREGCRGPASLEETVHAQRRVRLFRVQASHDGGDVPFAEASVLQFDGVHVSRRH